MPNEKKRTDNPLQDWLSDRLSRGDITYKMTVDGRDVFHIVRPLYADDEQKNAEG